MKLYLMTIGCIILVCSFVVSCAPKNTTCRQASQKVMEDVWEGTQTNESLNRAIYFCIESANEGNVTSQYNLSMLYMLKNNRKESKESYKWTLKAANNGHMDSQFHLGLMYEKGIVVKQDFNKAEEWYKKAAKNGSLLAEEKIGEIDKQKREIPK